MASQGRLSSPRSERSGLPAERLREARGGRGQPRSGKYHTATTSSAPSAGGVTRTLAGTNRSVLISFLHVVQKKKGMREDNPARQTPEAAAGAGPSTTCETHKADEARRILRAAESRSRSGRRSTCCFAPAFATGSYADSGAEHFSRDGFVWVTPDIAKGGRAGDACPSRAIFDRSLRRFARSVAVDEFVAAGAAFPQSPFGITTRRWTCASLPCSPQSLLRSCGSRLGAGRHCAEHVTPHDLRRAFADHIARGADTRVAQYALGHAYLATTDVYLSVPLLDEVADAISGSELRRQTDVPINPENAPYSPRGDDRNRTGVDGFAGRCVATPPRRQGSKRRALHRYPQRSQGD